MERGAMIVIARGAKLWQEALPALRTYPHKLTLSSNQNVALTPENLLLAGRKTPRAWDSLLAALK
jgi:hypothetical protein